MLFKSIISLAFVIAAAASQATKGKAFDHVFIIFLENTDYAKAASDSILETYLPQGILLDNYYSVTHPSEPNYVAVTGGDYFGMADDALYHIPSNITTIVDLLEEKSLTWKAYQQDAPTPCFTDFQFNGLYFRKHNPFIIYDSIANNATRCNNVVPATQLDDDIAAGNLPNYSFYTPNMINDGHNTTVANASKWLDTFLPPLLNNMKFLDNTLVVLTFDEADTYPIANKVWTMLLGDVVNSLKNTTDSTFYTHYSLLSTIESNWDLGNLGRQDANTTVSNVFEVVAKSTGYKNVDVRNPPLMNDTIPGFLTPPPSTSSSTPTGGAVPKSTNAAGLLDASKVVVTLTALVGVVATFF
ncbi:hypothetical protein BGZ76_004946 [Entomortierella beljakovae]|nr:hypothetical protein BGZ76_004946 [Entomortierella beljakovae]